MERTRKERRSLPDPCPRWQQAPDGDFPSLEAWWSVEVAGGRDQPSPLSARRDLWDAAHAADCRRCFTRATGRLDCLHSLPNTARRVISPTPISSPAIRSKRASCSPAGHPRCSPIHSSPAPSPRRLIPPAQTRHNSRVRPTAAVAKAQRGSSCQCRRHCQAGASGEGSTKQHS